LSGGVHVNGEELSMEDCRLREICQPHKVPDK